MICQTYSKSPMHEVIDELFDQVHLIARFGTISLVKGKDVSVYQLRLDKLNLQIMRISQPLLSGAHLKTNKATIKYLMEKIERTKENTPKQAGVYFDKSTKKWCAKVSINRKRIHLGLFEEYDDAVNTRKEAEK